MKLDKALLYLLGVLIGVAATLMWILGNSYFANLVGENESVRALPPMFANGLPYFCMMILVVLPTLGAFCLLPRFVYFSATMTSTLLYGCFMLIPMFFPNGLHELWPYVLVSEGLLVAIVLTVFHVRRTWQKKSHGTATM